MSAITDVSPAVGKDEVLIGAARCVTVLPKRETKLPQTHFGTDIDNQGPQERRQVIGSQLLYL